jgi:two-component system phosphate regulon sensor histidine kinase PhoR
MIRRLCPPYLLLLLATLAGLGLAVSRTVGDRGLRLELLAQVAAAAGLASVACVALSVALARQLGRPLRDLMRAAERVGEDDGGARLAVEHARDEVADLGRSFNAMSARLAGRLAALEEERQQLRTILGGMVEGVVALDAGQRIVFANGRALQLLDLPSPPPVGRRLWEVVRRRALLEVVQRALDSPEPQREEFHWAGPGPRHLTIHAARLPGPPPRGAVLVLHDTSDLRRLERLRQDFVANVSHELKTPLSVIKACAEALLAGAADDPGHRARFLERIADQGERLHALILDLLSLAQIESGDELFEFRAVPVGAAVDACLERHRARAEARRQSVSAAPPPTGDGPADGVAVWADEEAVDHILDNLIDNALKYTPEGGTIRVGWRAEGGQVCLEVADTGIGIPEPDLPRIFERFYRVDKARSRELGGTGLGLSIVKHLAQAMHGQVRVASRPGEGTTFTVCLPVAHPDPTGPAVDAAR